MLHLYGSMVGFMNQLSPWGTARSSTQALPQFKAGGRDDHGGIDHDSDQVVWVVRDLLSQEMLKSDKWTWMKNNQRVVWKVCFLHRIFNTWSPRLSLLGFIAFESPGHIHVYSRGCTLPLSSRFHSLVSDFIWFDALVSWKLWVSSYDSYYGCQKRPLS